MLELPYSYTLSYPCKVILILSNDPGAIKHVYTRTKRNAILDLYA